MRQGDTGPRRGADEDRRHSPNHDFATGALRAFAGALIFAMPMMMTMEMWALGFAMDRFRLAILLIVTFPLLVGLSHYIGFEPTFDWKEDVIDALVAYAIAFLTSAILLWLFGVVTGGAPLVEAIGKVSLQAAPGAIGALLAFSQLGDREEIESEQGQTGHRYPRELFFMLLGALFLSLNIAPTEEMVLISYQMTPWHTLALIGVSLAIMHGFGTTLVRSGRSIIGSDSGHATVFLRFTTVGYAVALLASIASLWLFGRFEGTEINQLVQTSSVLAFPASVGAAAARMVL